MPLFVYSFNEKRVFFKVRMIYYILRGKHKNTPWFQVVMKSKLTGKFLQNWWLQLHKLIQFHVVLHTHTLNVPPSCYLANIDAIIYLRPDSLQHIRRDRVDSCSETDGRLECPFLWSQMHPLSMKFPCHFKIDLLAGGSTLNLRLKARCTVTPLFVLWNSSTHQPRCVEVSAILHFTALWRRAGKLKFSWVIVSAVPYL
jgi:hypothetical protein